MKKNQATKPKRTKEILMTVTMLDKMEGRLIHRMVGIRDELKSEIHGIKSDINGVQSELHRVALLVEE